MAARRADIDPGDFAPLAPWAFVAAAEAHELRFRLAGEAVIELHGAQLRGQSLVGLWRPEHRGRLRAALSASLVHGGPLVAMARAANDLGQRLELEILFAPLIGPSGAPDRFLGLYQPRLGALAGPVGDLSLVEAVSLEGAPAHSRAHLRLAALHGRRIA